MTTPPNIIWILTDEQRRDSLGCYGAPWARTPHLDALAANGTRFASAYTPSPVCVSARAAMLTGQCCSRLGVLNNHHALPPDKARFLTTEFVRAGYQTACFGKQHYNCKTPAFETQVFRVLDDRVSYSDYAEELDEEAHGVVRYPNERRPWLFAGPYPGRMEDTPEAHCFRDALDWLAGRDRSRPFLLRVSLNAPHTPVVAPEPFDTMIDPDDITLPIDDRDRPGLPAPIRENLCEMAGAHRLTTDEIRRVRQCYYGRAALVDELIGRFLAEAQPRGVMENTITVFTSDHGAHLGDHGFFQKQSFYEASAGVPFIVAGPGITQGACIESPVSVGGLLPTLLELSGLAVPEPTDFPSLAGPLCRDAQLHAAPVVSEIDFGIWDYRDGDRYLMVRDGDWKLACFHDPTDPKRFPPDDGLMLHNLAEDPGERRNLAGRPDFTDVVDRLQTQINEWDAVRGPDRS